MEHTPFGMKILCEAGPWSPDPRSFTSYKQHLATTSPAELYRRKNLIEKVKDTDQYRAYIQMVPLAERDLAYRTSIHPVTPEANVKNRHVFDKLLSTWKSNLSTYGS